MRIWKAVALLATIQFAAPLNAQSTGPIVSIKDFLKTCPDNDPAIAQIKADFALFNNGVPVTSIACTEPYNQMDPAKMSTELAILQSLRVLYYMDRGRSSYLPWTTLRLYDWIKSKIAGINFVPGSSFACCTTVAGKNVIFGRVLDTLSIGAYRDFTGISGGISVIAHEARHVDGFPHVGCCPVGAGACDQSYDEKNLSPYGIQDWLARNWLNGNLNVGMFCSLSNEIRTTTQYIASENTQSRFCDTRPPLIPTMTITDTPGGACSLRTLQLAANGVANAADYVTANLWNGTITVLFGTNIGPATPVTSPSITPQRTIATTLGNTQVFFDGVAAPMIYAYPNQLSAVAPFSLGSGGSQINGVSNDYVEVQSNGKLSNIVPVQHQRSSPGIFALDGSGTGQAAALNQDFTINSSGNPAARGSVVQLFATGFGQTNPPLTDGQINPSTAPLPAISPPLVSIGGTSAQVVFAGAAPEAVAGLYQINAVVPNSIQPGDAIPLRITFGDVSNTVTIAVK